jgi:5'(3')-deoxyribonucleotidase
MKTARIAVDIDEVLAPFLPTMKKWRPPKPSPRPSNRYVYRDIYNIPEWESAKMVREFYDSEEFSKMPPIKNAIDAMLELKKDNELFIMTGRQEIVRDKTEKWVRDNFPGIFSEVIMTNSFTASEVPKSDVCKMLNIGLIFDDNMGVCQDCMNENIGAINFIGDPVYPWCYESTISVKSWRLVCDTLRESRETS